MKKTGLFLAAITIITCAVHAEPQRTKEQIDAVKNFSVDGVSLGKTPQELQAAGLTLEIDAQASESELGLERYSFYPKHNNFGAMFLYFFDNKLYQYRIRYNPKHIHKIGGWTTLYKKLCSKIGEPEKTADLSNSMPEEIIWKFYNENIEVSLYERIWQEKDEKYIYLTIKDKTAGNQLAKRREENANVGF